MMVEVTIVSEYNGRYHQTIIKRSERVCQIVVDGKLVYDDERLEESILPDEPAREAGKK